MTRQKLKERKLPDYTKGEEIFNMVSHIVGGGFGIIALVSCVIYSFVKGNVYSIIGSFIFTNLLLKTSCTSSGDSSL